MTQVGIFVLALLSLGYDRYNDRIGIEKEVQNIRNISEEVALHIDSHIKEKVAIATSLSFALLIRNALLKSNAEFGTLPDDERRLEIERRNRQWMNTAEVDDPFVRGHMANPVAEYLKHQQEVLGCRTSGQRHRGFTGQACRYSSLSGEAHREK
jgi:hypothetical protein